MLVMGHSASTFAVNRRTTEISASKKGPRQMLVDSVIAEIYAARYSRAIATRESENQVFTLDAIEKLLAAATLDPKTSEENHTTQTGFVSGHLKTVLLHNRPGESLSSKFVKSRKLTTIQLLTALEACMAKESFALSVDYFSLHMRCFELLRTIRREMDQVFIKYFGPMYTERESEYPFLVGYIFMIVFGGSQASETLFRKMRSHEKGSKALIQASEIVARIIKKEGSTEIEKVKKESHIFGGLELQREVQTPPAKKENLEEKVKAFNKLPRPKTVPSRDGSQKLNHWQFSIRNVDPTFDPPDIVFFTNLEAFKMHVAAPQKGIHIISSPSQAVQIDTVAFLLLDSFVGGLLKGADAGLPKFAPWSWACDDKFVSKALEERLRELGVREELCAVHVASDEEVEMAESVWDSMREKIVANFAG
jgi:hypothetical protein